MSKLTCPMSLMEKDCIKDECAWWIDDLRGQDQQTGQESVKKGCVVSFSLIGHLEVAHTNRAVSSELNALRNQYEQGQMAPALVMIANLMNRAEQRQRETNGHIPQNHPSIGPTE